MHRTTADRICIRLHEVAKFNLARCRRLVGIVVAVIATRLAMLNDIAPRFQGKVNFMSKPRRPQSFSIERGAAPPAPRWCGFDCRGQMRNGFLASNGTNLSGPVQSLCPLWLKTLFFASSAPSLRTLRQKTAARGDTLPPPPEPSHASRV